MQDVKLIRAQPNDIALISSLARTIWQQHYPSIISQAQIDYMLDRMYSSATLEKQMQEGVFYFLILHGTEPLGFISVNEENEGEWFLGKFYINQEKGAKGIGSAAFGRLLTVISPKKIRLTVNRQNYKSINFYFKNGFTISEVADFDIGNGYVMNDFVMVWKKPE